MVVELVSYRVRSGREEEFERLQSDLMTRLRRTRGFVSRRLMRSTDPPAEYQAEIRWVSREYRDRAMHPDGGSGAREEPFAALLDGPPARRIFEEV